MARLVVFRRGGGVSDHYCPGGGRCEGCREALRVGRVVVPCFRLLEASLERYERPEDVKWFIEC